MKMGFILFALVAMLATIGHAQGAKEKKPNIVFVLMDNLGYGEVGVYGGGVTRGAPTPRIDQLATEGTRLTNYNMEAQCTPSRSALMTGRFAIRSGTHSVPMGGGLEGLTQWEVTIAELLSDAGYATAAFGKWHLGSDQGRLPNAQGFDASGTAFPARPTRRSGLRNPRPKRPAPSSNKSWRAAKAKRAATWWFTIWSSGGGSIRRSLTAPLIS